MLLKSPTTQVYMSKDCTLKIGNKKVNVLEIALFQKHIIWLKIAKIFKMWPQGPKIVIAIMTPFGACHGVKHEELCTPFRLQVWLEIEKCQRGTNHIPKASIAETT